MADRGLTPCVVAVLLLAACDRSDPVPMPTSIDVVIEVPGFGEFSGTTESATRLVDVTGDDCVASHAALFETGTEWYATLWYTAAGSRLNEDEALSYALHTGGDDPVGLLNGDLTVVEDSPSRLEFRIDEAEVCTLPNVGCTFGIDGIRVVMEGELEPSPPPSDVSVSRYWFDPEGNRMCESGARPAN